MHCRQAGSAGAGLSLQQLEVVLWEGINRVKHESFAIQPKDSQRSHQLALLLLRHAAGFMGDC